ncbi:hypothetical protein CTI12_AA006930 [Artemisia annua]|uniref:Uncharacterized protein n=1 Tax=Artemisia annua TaxID=35608 RepID=A0A2U1Q3A0_ARTAN|nr:hypothetical protein CTI12_AA006930 [Artemisia annua]
MGSNLVFDYKHLSDQLEPYKNIPQDLISSFRNYIDVVYESDLQDRFSKPMLWVGIYIALASLFCLPSMLADVAHGFRSRNIWFPCKYFTLNAASLSVIAVAIKIPMDLNDSIPDLADQAANIGSMSFMCTMIMMANLLPSLASIESKELVTNIAYITLF